MFLLHLLSVSWDFDFVGQAYYSEGHCFHNGHSSPEKLSHSFLAATELMISRTLYEKIVYFKFMFLRKNDGSEKKFKLV